MGKVKTLKGQKNFSKKSKTFVLIEHRPDKMVFKPHVVREILAECILSGDLETFQDVFLAYIRSQSKTKLAAKSKLGRQTIYDLLDENKKFNPEWETLRSLLIAI